MGVTSERQNCTGRGPSRGGQGQNRRYREIGTLNFSRTLQTARNNLYPDTAAAPEITYASYVLCGHESDFFPTTLETLTQKDPLCLDMGLLVLRYGVNCSGRARMKTGREIGILEHVVFTCFIIALPPGRGWS